MIITLILATTIPTALLTWFLATRRQTLSPTYGALAPVWREGYLTGVADERTAAAWDVPGYGANRCNPYRGDEGSWRESLKEYGS
ncbi:hypothetical protein [Paenarthrobacter sp. YJN-5]|uniref:hypothetical protein n=1 Tax=Paenarthrobacter sp. YJN-5 TaxID=2735316 RepID=UPI001878C835|nr:hypothetical protein [Paenarthrobacter sp. YJN-5]QOT19619.1 hypothetical protein HMI59_23680 [Paenarthrobacter sp. YJN-5]